METDPGLVLSPGRCFPDVVAGTAQQTFTDPHTADFIHLSGVVDGPAGYERPVDIRFPSGEAIVTTPFGADATVAVRGIGEGSRADPALGISVGGVAHFGTVDDAQSGGRLAIRLGTEYVARISVNIEAQTPADARMARSLATPMSSTGVTFRTSELAAPLDGLPPPIFYSPFTKSVIRAGEVADPGQ